MKSILGLVWNIYSKYNHKSDNKGCDVIKHKFTQTEKDWIIANSKLFTKRQRRVFYKYYVDGKSIETIAVDINYSYSTVQRELKTIRDRCDLIK